LGQRSISQVTPLTAEVPLAQRGEHLALLHGFMPRPMRRKECVNHVECARALWATAPFRQGVSARAAAAFLRTYGDGGGQGATFRRVIDW